MLEKQNRKIIFLFCTNLGTHISISLPIKQQQGQMISIILSHCNCHSELVIFRFENRDQFVE